MRRLTHVWLIWFAVAIASCGTTNHLDRYELKGAPFYFSASIDQPSEETDSASSSSSDDSSMSWWVRILIALIMLPFHSHPEPFTTDPSLSIYFSSGLSDELDEKLWIRSMEVSDDSRFRANVRITSCDLHDTARLPFEMAAILRATCE